MAQNKLSSLLLLITGPQALSIIEMNSELNATEKYQLLKTEYNTPSIITFSTLYRKIFRCTLANHKGIREYGDEIARARNKLKELGYPVNELAVTCCFLDGLDSSFQNWKDMYLAESQKQQSVALSSTEAEYVGQAACATSVMWARNMLEELRINEKASNQKAPTIIYADNQGAIKLATNPIFQQRTKHIAVKFHYTRDLIQQGEISLEYRPTGEMIADGLTKPLGRVAFGKFVTALGLKSVKS